MDAHAVATDAMAWLQAQPAWASLGTLGAFAGLEYVVPPVPGDTVAIAGGVLVAQGVLSAPLVLAVLTLGSTLGACAAYGVGVLAATQPVVRRLLFRFVAERHFEAAAVKYRRFGRWFLVANRFFPGVRASFLFAAGLFRMPVRDVVVLSALSACAWNGLLLVAGVALGANLHAVIDLVATYSSLAWGTVAAVLVLLVARLVWKLTRRGV